MTDHQRLKDQGLDAFEGFLGIRDLRASALGEVPEVERRMLTEFKQRHGRLPFANLRS
ncbi:hypothetical protein [Desulforudis sp. DRI-14]|uniref:hypothetical protein n=1 Tax=Desulforudis sp. DRI-14 TaxID=3459793 RepID=UPI004043383B